MKARAPFSAKPGLARVSAQSSAVKFASAPPLVKWPAARLWQSGAARDGADHMRLDLDRGRRGGGGCQLRVERCGDPVGALRRKGRRRVEQPEIARMRHLRDAFLEPRNRPVQQRVVRQRDGEIEAGEFATERGKIDRRGDRTGGDPCLGSEQRIGQPIVEAPALLARRKQRGARRDGRAGEGALGHGQAQAGSTGRTGALASRCSAR